MGSACGRAEIVRGSCAEEWGPRRVCWGALEQQACCRTDFHLCWGALVCDIAAEHLCWSWVSSAAPAGGSAAALLFKACISCRICMGSMHTNSTPMCRAACAGSWTGSAQASRACATYACCAWDSCAWRCCAWISRGPCTALAGLGHIANLGQACQHNNLDTS